MKVQAIIAIIVFIAAIIVAQPVGIPFVIGSYDLGHDSNGYKVMAQTQFNNEGQVVAVIIDPQSIQNGDWQVRELHEFGHVKNHSWSEAQCDDFANSFNVGFVEDAYHNGR